MVRPQEVAPLVPPPTLPAPTPSPRSEFRLESGEICGSTHRLQFDHTHPFALSGESTVSNIHLACAAHNLLAARRIFGDALMDRYAPVRSSQTPAASP
ncbi:MAG: HNH endonuclease [Anaeromyxobacteraceae bacterium]